MRRLKHCLYGAAGVLLLAGIIALTSPQEVHSQGNNTVNAKIVNTTAEPVPTAAQGTTTVVGNVGITGTPTVGLAVSANTVKVDPTNNTVKLDQTGSNNIVQAKQLNAWSVGITGTPSVQVANTATSPALVHEVENAARQPFQKGVNLTLSAGQSGGMMVVVAGGAVPGGKLLVIEHASVAARLPSGQKAIVQLYGGSSGGAADDFFTLQSQGIFGGDELFTADHQTRLSVDAANTSQLLVQRNDSAGTANVDLMVSGYYVNL